MMDTDMKIDRVQGTRMLRWEPESNRSTERGWQGKWGMGENGGGDDAWKVRSTTQRPDRGGGK